MYPCHDVGRKFVINFYASEDGSDGVKKSKKI